MLSSGSLFIRRNARSQKQLLFRQAKTFSQSNLWKPQKYFVYFKAAKGSYAETDWLLREEGDSRVSEKKRREML